jgi:hypothetical protein
MKGQTKREEATMPIPQIRIGVAIAFSAAVAAFGVAVGAQARAIGYPPAHSKRTKPVRSKAITFASSGRPCCSGVHVKSAAEERTE